VSPTDLFADFQKGLNAAKRGDYSIALKEWRPLAEQGHPDSQYNLGVMHANGHGVPKDYGITAKWYKLAAKQGNVDAQYNPSKISN